MPTDPSLVQDFQPSHRKRMHNLDFDLHSSPLLKGTTFQGEELKAMLHFRSLLRRSTAHAESRKDGKVSGRGCVRRGDALNMGLVKDGGEVQLSKFRKSSALSATRLVSTSPHVIQTPAPPIAPPIRSGPPRGWRAPRLPKVSGKQREIIQHQPQLISKITHLDRPTENHM